MIFGVQGALRKHELCDLTMDKIIDKQDMVVVKIPAIDVKTKRPKSFIVNDDFYNIYKKYVDLRPKDIDSKTSRFFLCYRNGKCTKQPIGINTIGNIPKLVAKYLNLENADAYTGHCYRRTSTTLLADSGADMLTIKRHGGWKSDSVAAGYIENSTANKLKISKQISSSVFRHSSSSDQNIPPVRQIENLPSTSTSAINNNTISMSSIVDKDSMKNFNFHVSNCTNITFIVENNKKNES